MRQTEGPFFTPMSPERAELIEPGMAGQPIELVGFVLTRGCKPVPGALVDFWQADDKGEYDNKGYRLRGHQFADSEGRFRLRTIVPGVYTGRTRHFHVKVQPKGGRTLTTQLYFPGEPGNRRDGLFRRELLIRQQRTKAGSRGASISCWIWVRTFRRLVGEGTSEWPKHRLKRPFRSRGTSFIATRGR